VAQTVWSAFNTFRRDSVDLDPDQTKRARSSRDYLFGQITSISGSYSDFPKVQTTYRPFGSFARNSKIRPLDDIDFLVPLIGKGTSEYQHPDASNFWLRLDDPSSPLANFPDGYGFVNSTKVLNKIRSSLASVPNYQRSDLKRTGEAVTLNLISYPWVFDIVPAVPILDYSGNVLHYLIPDGMSNWKRTDPRVDANNVTRVNSWHNGQFLLAIRLLKYWNRRVHKPRLGSYYFENLALKVFDYAPAISDFPNAIDYFFRNFSSYLNQPFPDPKKLGPNLDADVDWLTKNKITEAANEAQSNCRLALYPEARQEHREAINYWKRVFGSDFPDYG